MTALLLALTMSTAQSVRAPARATVADVAWIVGSWTIAGSSVTVEERWTDGTGGAMLGVSRTVKEGRMVAFEYLRIVERDGSLVYVAQPNGRPPTEFVLTLLTPTSATFENPVHDFPRMIAYTLRPDGALEARVSDGGERGQTFVFRPGPWGGGEKRKAAFHNQPTRRRARLTRRAPHPYRNSRRRP